QPAPPASAKKPRHHKAQSDSSSVARGGNEATAAPAPADDTTTPVRVPYRPSTSDSLLSVIGELSSRLRSIEGRMADSVRAARDGTGEREGKNPTATPTPQHPTARRAPKRARPSRSRADAPDPTTLTPASGLQSAATDPTSRLAIGPQVTTLADSVALGLAPD